MSLRETMDKAKAEELRLKEKVEELQADIKILNKLLLGSPISDEDKILLKAALKKYKSFIGDVDSVQKLSAKLRRSYDEYSFKWREIKRMIEQLYEKMLSSKEEESATFPVELVDETGEIKSIQLSKDVVRHLFQTITQMKGRASITDKKKPDGTAVIRVMVDGVNQEDTPIFIQKLYKSATSQTDLALAKLLKIAKNQQIILTKLAGGPVSGKGNVRYQQDPDPNVEYLRSAVQAALVNAHLKATNYYVRPLEGHQNGPVIMPTGYQVSVDGADPHNAARQAFTTALKQQVASQKPDLSANLSIVFTS